MISDKFYEIMKNNESSFDDLIGEIKDLLEQEKKNGNIKSYNYYIDDDVYDSCGLSIYYLSICWIDFNDNLYIIGTNYNLN